jgi:hypothetical protein
MSLPTKTHAPSRAAQAGRLLGLALLSVFTASCVVEERRVVYQRPPAPVTRTVVTPVIRPVVTPVYRPVYVGARIYPVLPFGARITYVRGQRCWYHNGSYYRPHPRGSGFVIFVP